MIWQRSISATALNCSSFKITALLKDHYTLQQRKLWLTKQLNTSPTCNWSKLCISHTNLYVNFGHEVQKEQLGHQKSILCMGDGEKAWIMACLEQAAVSIGSLPY